MLGMGKQCSDDVSGMALPTIRFARDHILKVDIDVTIADKARHADWLIVDIGDRATQRAVHGSAAAIRVWNVPTGLAPKIGELCRTGEAQPDSHATVAVMRSVAKISDVLTTRQNSPSRFARLTA